MKKGRAPDPFDPEDRYCYYCQKQYANLGTFKRHIVREHGLNMARRLNLLTQAENDVWVASLDSEGLAYLKLPSPLGPQPFVPYTGR